jgi:ELWxxDGT repeat protein
MKTNYAKLLQYLTLFSFLFLVSCGGGGSGSGTSAGLYFFPGHSSGTGAYGLWKTNGTKEGTALANDVA